MTWSIIARDASGAVGVAVASRAFAVGALCSHGRSGVGALSTQALVNPLYGPRGLALLEQGRAANEAVHAMTNEDAGRDHRQVHVIDRNGHAAAHTGRACIEWCGHHVGDGFSVAGNMLAGPAVLEATAVTYATSTSLAFPARLLAALRAGEDAGGDKRGKQAAALLVYTTEAYPFLDLRVDDHDEPCRELSRLYERSFERYQPFLACLPSRARPAGITDRALIDAEIAAFHERGSASAR